MRLNDGSFLPAFIRQAFPGENLTIFGDGTQLVVSVMLMIY